MVILGKQACIIQRSGKISDIRPFSNECSNMVKVTIINSALAYDCKHTTKIYLLVSSNVLYIPSMDNNKIPPFVMIEAWLLVNDVSRTHCVEDVSHESHSIIVTEEDINKIIPLRLDLIFSFLPTRNLTPE